MDGGVLTNDTLFAGFRIARLLAEGGASRVYLARDQTLGRDVALKVFKLDPSVDSERFLAEAKLTARLDHPSIVRVLQAGDASGAIFLALEYIAGRTLSEAISERSLDSRSTRGVLLQILEGLTYLHAQGVVHGDLKPDNVVLGADGQLRLVDFGLSSSPGVPARGSGTDAWLSPQRWLAQHALQHADDVWAFGVLVTELLTGKSPWPAAAVSRAAFAGVALEPPTLDGELGAIARACLAWEPSLRPTAAALAERVRRLELEERPPFRGLRPFAEDDALDFHGRDDETRLGLELLNDSQLVVVSGPSGVGKSSFVHARLVPRLRAQLQKLSVLSFRPGARPLRSLAHALGGDGLTARLTDDPAHLATLLRAARASRQQDLLLVVDQLEEVFTLAQTREREAFFEALTDVQSARVVLVVRDEFLGRLFQTALAPRHPAVLSLRPSSLDDLERAVREPVLRCAGTLEPASLARRIASDVLGQPAPLPLLQFACESLWDPARRSLRATDYERLGGAAGILAAQARDFLATLDPAAKAQVRALFLTVVNADGTRRPTARAHLPAFVDQLIAQRLLVGRDDDGVAVVELAHESLVPLWSDLRRWLAESTEAHRLQGDLEASAERWERVGSRDADLWRENVALTRDRLDSLPLSGRAQRYLTTSAEFAERATRRRRNLLGALLVLAITVAIGASALAVQFRENERRALEQQRELREIAENLGEVSLEFAAFDFDGSEVRAAQIAGLGRSWRLWPADPHNRERPLLSQPIAIRELAVSASADATTATFLAPGGDVFLEVTDRGGDCPSAWFRLLALPGYLERRKNQKLHMRLAVPTCRASSSAEVEVRPGLWIDRTETSNAAFAPFEAMLPRMGYARVLAPRTTALRNALESKEPVSGIDAFTAAAFCRSMGKRLPTSAEWAEAQSTSRTGRANLDGDEDGWGGPAAVDDDALDVTPQGVRSLDGNVREWTSSDSDYDPRQPMRFTLGGDWSMPGSVAAKLQLVNRNPPQAIDFALGVRCARGGDIGW